MTRNTKESKFN